MRAAAEGDDRLFLSRSLSLFEAMSTASPARSNASDPPPAIARTGLATETARAHTAEDEDCMSCRLIGVGTMMGLGFYSLVQARGAAPPGLSVPAQAEYVLARRGGAMGWRLLGYGTCTLCRTDMSSRSDVSHSLSGGSGVPMADVRRQRTKLTSQPTRQLDASPPKCVRPYCEKYADLDSPPRRSSVPRRRYVRQTSKTQSAG